jgi:hypothetical protein
VFIAFILAILFSPFGEHSQLQNGIQGAGIFVALFTAIIALGTADRKRKQVNIKIEPSINLKQSATYHKNQMKQNLSELYKDLPETFKSYQVNFRMTNDSGFSLEKPTLTFTLPYEKQHPYKAEDQTMYEIRSFNSNTYNAPHEFYLLFEENIILSKTILPFWNNQDSMTIWIRMVIDDGKFEPFKVNVSINCSNADGKTYPIEIRPKELLKGVTK